MHTIELYKTPTCRDCKLVEQWLDESGLEDNENVTIERKDVSHNEDLRDEMLERVEGRFIIPQIFLDGEYLGEETDGLEQLKAKVRELELM